MKLLLVEDHAELASNIIHFLKQENYVCDWACTITQARDMILMDHYQLILLDITLPDGDGISYLNEIKQAQDNCKVIIISAQNTLDYKILGLDSGADDYITKPFPLPELHSRIKAVLRRGETNAASQELTFNEIELNLDSMSCTIHGKLLNLTKKEFNLLTYFINNKNRVLSKQAIATHLWGEYTFNLDNVDFIYQHLKNLRRKIAEAGGEDYVQTVYGMGYKWAE